MKIAFLLFARLGDVCCGIPAYSALREKYPDADLNWVTLKQYEPLIPKCGNTIIHNVLPFGNTPPWAKPPKFDLVIKAQPMWRHREWELSKQHAVDLICKWSGVAPKRKSIDIEIPEMVSKFVGRFLPSEPFVTICSSPCYSCGNWNNSQRQSIVTMFRKMNVPVVSVGGSDGVCFKGAIHLHGKLSYVQTIAVVNASRLYIGPDNGVTWLACAAKNARKLCLIDKNRLKMGIVGFQNYLSDSNIVDIYYQDPLQRQLERAKGLWNG